MQMHDIFISFDIYHVQVKSGDKIRLSEKVTVTGVKWASSQTGSLQRIQTKA